MWRGRVYYNDNDEFACNWLCELMHEGLIPEGDIDQRSIRDVTARDLRGYRQCHFFAGIGGWPLALALAGWPDECEIWTGSCPCQPFSAAGKARRIEPEISPLVDGFPNRVGILRGAGNAIVPSLAAVFIAAAREAMND